MAARRLLWWLFPSYLLITCLAVAAVTLHATSVLREFHVRQVRTDLGVRAQLLEADVTGHLVAGETETLRSLVTQWSDAVATRLTVIDAKGEVVADSAEDPGQHGKPCGSAGVRGGPAGRTRSGGALQPHGASGNGLRRSSAAARVSKSSAPFVRPYRWPAFKTLSRRSTGRLPASAW